MIGRIKLLKLKKDKGKRHTGWRFLMNINSIAQDKLNASKIF